MDNTVKIEREINMDVSEAELVNGYTVLSDTDPYGDRDRPLNTIMTEHTGGFLNRPHGLER